jgi:hypothetical protein
MIPKQSGKLIRKSSAIEHIILDNSGAWRRVGWIFDEDGSGCSGTD